MLNKINPDLAWLQGHSSCITFCPFSLTDQPIFVDKVNRQKNFIFRQASCSLLYGFVHAKLLQCVRLFATPWTVALQAPVSMEFSRQEYWSGLPCPPPGDLPDPGIELVSLKSHALTGRFSTTSTSWEPPILWLRYWKWNEVDISSSSSLYTWRRLCLSLYIKINYHSNAGMFTFLMWLLCVLLSGHFIKAYDLAPLSCPSLSYLFSQRSAWRSFKLPSQCYSRKLFLYHYIKTKQKCI